MAEVAVLGAVGYAGAIAAQLLYRHPFFELAHVTARAEAGQRLDDVHPRTRVPLELEVFDARSHAVDAAVVAYPHGAAAPVVGRAARARHARRRSLGRLPAARPGDLRRLVRRAQGARDLRAGRLRAAGAHARGRARAPIWSPTRAATRPRRCSAWRRWRGPGVIGDVVIDAQVGRLRRRPRRRRTRRTSSRPTRTSRPTRSPGHRHTPEIEQELRRARRRRDDHVHAAPAAAGPGRARLLLRHAVARELSEDELAEPVRRRVRARAVRRAAHAARSA